MPVSSTTREDIESGPIVASEGYFDYDIREGRKLQIQGVYPSKVVLVRWERMSLCDDHEKIHQKEVMVDTQTMSEANLRLAIKNSLISLSVTHYVTVRFKLAAIGY